MSAPLQGTAWRSMVCIGRGVLLEGVRRKEAHVLILLMGVFLLGALGARVVGIENAATGTFLYNLGLTLAWMFAHVLVLLMSVNQVPGEIENRTIYPILARPVERGSYLLGKWGASTLCGWGAYAVFAILVLLVTPRLESYATGMLLQMGILIFASLAVTAAMAQLISLILPRAMGALLLGGLVFLGTYFLGVIRSIGGDSWVNEVIRWVILYLPDFSKFNMTTRYTDGIEALSVGTFLGLLAYALVTGVVVTLISHRLFKRRAM